MTFNEIFKELLLENELNAKQLSKMIGIQDSTLYKYLNQTLPRVENIVKIANYFNCSVNYLMGIDELPKQTTFTQTYNKKIFFHRYDNLLLSNNLTHYKLSKKIGIKNSSLLAWKNGTIPYLDVLEKIAKYFSCSIDYLIGRSDS